MSKCPGCREELEADAITKMLPDPETDKEPLRLWHMGCHQRAYMAALDRQQSRRYLAGPYDDEIDTPPK